LAIDQYEPADAADRIAEYFQGEIVHIAHHSAALGCATCSELIGRLAEAKGRAREEPYNELLSHLTLESDLVSINEGEPT